MFFITLKGQIITLERNTLHGKVTAINGMYQTVQEAVRLGEE